MRESSCYAALVSLIVAPLCHRDENLLTECAALASMPLGRSDGGGIVTSFILELLVYPGCLCGMEGNIA